MKHPRFLAALAALALVATPVIAAAQPFADVTAGAASIDFRPTVGDVGLELSVSGPEGFYLSQTFGPGEAASFSVFDADGNLRPAGSYVYELRAVPALSDGERQALEAARETGGAQALQKAGQLPAERPAMNGAFSIIDGAFVMGGETEPGAGPVAGGNRLATKDQVIPDDLIVQQSLCVGTDCVNGENFGFDTLRLKENNLRIHFDDTSTSSGFPSNDWTIVANDSASGGASYLAIEDRTAGRMPFKVSAGAKANSIFVASDGDVGIGTSSPAVDGVHITRGNTPALRLEQDGSSGFSPQTWDVAGNETVFFVRDATNGSKLPFKIQPNSPTNSLYISPNGVGIGTTSPSNALQVHRSDAASTSLLVENTNASPQVVTMTLDNTATDLGSWEFRVAGNGSFFINDTDSTGQVMRILAASGNVLISHDLTVNGTFSNPSSRTLKTDIEPVDPKQILERVASLPINKWTYIKDESKRRHIGPFTEDFGNLFGLGTKGKNIIPLDVQGVTLAAVQGLYQTVQTLQEEVAALKAGNCSVGDNE